MCHIDSGEERGECKISIYVVLYKYMINMYVRVNVNELYLVTGCHCLKAMLPLN